MTVPSLRASGTVPSLRASGTTSRAWAAAALPLHDRNGHHATMPGPCRGTHSGSTNSNDRLGPAVATAALGELRLGVLQATDPESVSRRLSTYQLAQRFEALPVDESVSDAWALLVSRLRAEGRKAPINDSWIAATAIAYGIPVVTQDADYDAMPDVRVIKI